MFLYHLYEATKKQNFDTQKCQEIVGNRLEASAEIGRLNHLKNVLGVFVEQVQNLIRPYLPHDESAVAIQEVLEQSMQLQAGPSSMRPTSACAAQRSQLPGRHPVPKPQERAGPSCARPNLQVPPQRTAEGSDRTNVKPAAKHSLAPPARTAERTLPPRPRSGEPQIPVRPKTADDAQILAASKRLTRVEQLRTGSPLRTPPPNKQERSRPVSSPAQAPCMPCVIEDLSDDESDDEFDLDALEAIAEEESVVPEIVVLSPEGISQKLLSPKFVVSKTKMAMRTSPQAPSKVLRSTSRIFGSGQQSMRASTSTESMKPNIVVDEAIIENDILFVSLLLMDRNEEDLPLAADNLTKSVLQTAKELRGGMITKSTALKKIRDVFYKVICAPADFIKTFIYHPGNQFFNGVDIADEHLNHLVRQKALANAKVSACVRNQNPDGPISEDLTDSFSIFEKSSNDIADDLEEMVNESFLYVNKNADENLQDLSVSGTEKTISGELIPIIANFEAPHENHPVVNQNQDSFLKSGTLPPTNIIDHHVAELFGRIEETLQIQIGEGEQHLIASKVIGRGIVYTVVPMVLDRHNYWQCRGSDFPQWFPGYYTVFQDTFDLIPQEQTSPSSVFLHAWRSMAPTLS